MDHNERALLSWGCWGVGEQAAIRQRGVENQAQETMGGGVRTGSVTQRPVALQEQG